ncbi:SRPBCC domain-containing protein [Longimicrobium terrae]|uniref:Uncharacterized protein YndB with AHSA1/START domain n=1 Tax=Longimicrobium terrae TaxID=1639882 RepID=A0A841GY75_9BACT|nr:uncharacterized protein YndB with AHSA1/START domain [Longimicrobium terrae]MBB6070688.1 uncharacterized protein YndB with AHSA1/START domain [Longimicrobium terrae]
MTGSASSTSTSRLVRAPRQAVYDAFTRPDALAAWLAPEGMTGRVHQWDLRVGGGYVMSLYYPKSMGDGHGKTAEGEDRYTARFVELDPPSRVVLAIDFESDDPAFAGEMIMQTTLEERPGGTEVTIAFRGLPPGIRPEDNDEGTRSSLEKLARYVETARDGQARAGHH